ncbi:MAG: FHA domain-containing protein [Sandaracinaceae bacterium]
MAFTLEYLGHLDGVPLSYFTGASVDLTAGACFRSAPTVRHPGESDPLPAEHIGAMRLGRRARNCVRVASAVVAPRHLLLYQTDDEAVFAVDLGSTNGTTIDDVPLVAGVPTRVSVGSTLRLAGFDFRLTAASPACAKR